MEKTKKIIMANINKVFARSGLKYVQIEKKLNLSKRMISTYMTKGSNRCFSHDTIKKIALEFNVSIDSLYGIKSKDDFIEGLKVFF